MSVIQFPVLTSFRDHLSGIRTYDVHAQNAIGFLTGEHFDHTIRVADASGSGVGGEGEGTLVVLDERLNATCQYQYT